MRKPLFGIQEAKTDHFNGEERRLFQIISGIKDGKRLVEADTP